MFHQYWGHYKVFAPALQVEAAKGIYTVHIKKFSRFKNFREQVTEETGISEACQLWLGFTSSYRSPESAYSPAVILGEAFDNVPIWHLCDRHITSKQWTMTLDLMLVVSSLDLLYLLWRTRNSDITCSRLWVNAQTSIATWLGAHKIHALQCLLANSSLTVPSLWLLRLSDTKTYVAWVWIMFSSGLQGRLTWQLIYMFNLDQYKWR